MRKIRNWLKNFSVARRLAYLRMTSVELGIDTFLLNCKCIVHVGANKGQERYLYERLNLRVIWIEALPNIYDELTKNLKSFKNQQAILSLLSSKSGETMHFNVAGNEGASSSIFDFAKHIEMWPDVRMTGRVELVSETLDDVIKEVAPVDAIVIDTQGAELLVLQGGLRVLQRVQYVMAEAADFDAYSGGCKLDELTDFMLAAGFVEVQRHIFASKDGLGNYYDVLWQRATLSKNATSK